MPPAKPLGGARTIVRVSLVVLVLVIVVGFAFSRISTSDFEISPGGAEPVAPLITIAGHGATKGSGQILLTDVLLTPLTWLSWLPARLDSSAQIVPADELVDPGVSTSQLDAQGYLEMAQAKSYATAAALTRLGYPVGETNDGAVISAVTSGSGAAHDLDVADVIVGVDGKPITTACGLIAAVHDASPGSHVDLTVRPATINSIGSISYGAPVVDQVNVGPPPDSNNAPTGCPGVTGPAKGYLGVAVGTNLAFHFPFAVSIATPNIGGPSAGLAMTLGIIDELSHGHLVDHHKIAATGTMAPDGAVGDVGGVPQKAIAVSRAGASLFLVPTGELQNAKSKVGSSLNVKVVATLNQALDDLMEQGGSITMANGTIESHSSHPPGS